MTKSERKAMQLLKSRGLLVLKDGSPDWLILDADGCSWALCEQKESWDKNRSSQVAWWDAFARATGVRVQVASSCDMASPSLFNQHREPTLNRCPWHFALWLINRYVAWPAKNSAKTIEDLSASGSDVGSVLKSLAHRFCDTFTAMNPEIIERELRQTWDSSATESARAIEHQRRLMAAVVPRAPGSN